MRAIFLLSSQAKRLVQTTSAQKNLFEEDEPVKFSYPVAQAPNARLSHKNKQAYFCDIRLTHLCQFLDIRYITSQRVIP